MTNPYYKDDFVTLYNADCFEHPELWNSADILITDPPYGIKWANHYHDSLAKKHKRRSPSRGINITNDDNLNARDEMLAIWSPDKPALVFASPKLIPPQSKQVLVWYKNCGSAGAIGQIAHWRRDWEAICLLGHWQDRPTKGKLYSSIIETNTDIPTLAKKLGHPTPKPVELMETLIQHCPDGIIADPFTGTGSTLIAAKNLGRKAIGFELEERHCETAALRLSQNTLPANTPE